MRTWRRTTYMLGLVMTGGLLAAACGPASVPPSATSVPTAVPPTVTAAPPTVTAVPPTAEPTAVINPAGTDINQTLPGGDAAQGRQLMDMEISVFSCNFCHVKVVVGGMLQLKGAGPPWLADQESGFQTIVERAETRYLDADYTGNATSAEQYLVESILLPDAHIIKYLNYESSPGRSWMPDDYGEKLTAQDVADIVAYLLTLE